jgi:hypothetical protein
MFEFPVACLNFMLTVAETLCKLLCHINGAVLSAGATNGYGKVTAVIAFQMG